jgi:hypothetical protein
MPNPQQRPYSIRIFVPDGDPDGLKLVEKSNWTGVGVVFNRSIYKEVMKRPEFDRTGVYVLVGMSEESAFPTIYVGEGESVKARLNAHYRNKDFWDWAIFFVSKDGSLNKAHVKHFEARLLERAKAAKQCKLYSDQPSIPPTLSEGETADVESFLLDMFSIFPLLGLGVFEKMEVSKEPAQLFYIVKRYLKATGYEDAKGFVVCQGSQLVKSEAATIRGYMSSMRKDFLEQGVIVDAGDHYVFTQDQVFKSPFLATGVVLGRSADGRSNWKTRDGVTLKEIQENDSETD